MTNPIPKPGDRMRVIYEGVYDGLDGDGFARVDGADDGFGRAARLHLDDAVSVEVLPPPEPAYGTVMIGYQGEGHAGNGGPPFVFCRENEEIREASWRITGRVTPYTYAEALEMTRVGRMIIDPDLPR